MSLIDKEREYSLLHVALSRVTKFTNLEIKDTEGLSKNRLCEKIHKHLKMSKYLEEENRLRHLEQITLKYFYQIIITNEQKNYTALGTTYG